MTTTIETVTDSQIAALRDESGEAGDLAQVAICAAALHGDETARIECVRVIRDAEAQFDYLYEVRASNGRTVGAYESHKAAVRACRREWSDCEVGHDGDLTSGGDRTLVWASEAESIDDDGARAVASIVRVQS